MKNRGRVIVAKVGLDGHTTGAAVVASGLRDAGFDVINLGTRVTPEQLVTAAIQEDADVIGVSILSGAHLNLTERLIRMAAEQGARSAIVVGGTIPDEDADLLRNMGAAAVFGPGAAMPDIVRTVEECVQNSREPRRGERAG